MAKLDISRNSDSLEAASSVGMDTNLFANPFIVPFFNFFYYLMLVPFRTAIDRNEGKYTLITNLIQQILCGVIHVGAVIFLNVMALDLIYKIRSDDVSSIVVLFEFVSNITSTMSALCLMYIMWWRRDKYLKVVNDTRCTFVSNRKLQSSHCVIYAISSVLLVVFGIVDWYLIQEKLLVEAAHQSSANENLFQWNNEKSSTMNDSTNKNNSHLNNLIQETIFEQSKIYLNYIFILYMSLFFIICQVVFFALVLTLRALGKEFCCSIESCCILENNGISNGIIKYRALKAATEEIRHVYGNSLLGYYVSSVAYYAGAPHALLGTRGEAERMIMIYFTASGVIWLIAAEFHYQTRLVMQKWIEYHTDRDDVNTDERLKLNAIAIEMFSNEVVIALSSKWFSVTYKHLGSMLGLVVTYGIIVFQLNRGHPL